MGWGSLEDGAVATKEAYSGDGSGAPEDDRVIPLPNGPRLQIIGEAPKRNRD
jgi:hypothetical protein